MSRLTTSPLARNWAVTRLGVGTGARIAAHSVGNLFRSSEGRKASDREFYRHEAQRMADELGRLKGSVMKAGQMLSLYGQYFLPSEAVEVLSSLQDDTQPVDWPVIAPVLARALGRRRLAELEVDETALAAASLGQVHRARRKRDGLELVLKIQYPGVADAIESDVTTMARIIGMTRLAPRGLSLESVFAEVREMLHREVDYVAERRFTEEFSQRMASDPRFRVPSVLSEYCSDQVLALTYEPGVSVRHASVQALPQGERDRLATDFVNLFLTEFFDWGMVQSDPHFGNFRFQLGGDSTRVVLLDFGATRVFGRGFIEGYARIVRGALLGPRDEVHAGAQAIGLTETGFPQHAHEVLADLCELIVEPFRRPDEGRVPEALMGTDGCYSWGESDLPVRVSMLVARSALSRWFRVPPREIVFLHRRMAGVFIMCAALHARVAAREAVLRRLEALARNGR